MRDGPNGKSDLFSGQPPTEEPDEAYLPGDDYVADDHPVGESDVTGPESKTVDSTL